MKISYAGLIIGFFYAICLFVFEERTSVEIFKKVTNFLIWFYIFMLLIDLFFLVIRKKILLFTKTLLVKTGLPTKNIDDVFAKNKFVKIFLKIIISNGCLVAGAFMLNLSLDTAPNINSIEISVGISGGLLLIFGLIASSEKFSIRKQRS